MRSAKGEDYLDLALWHLMWACRGERRGSWDDWDRELAMECYARYARYLSASA